MASYRKKIIRAKMSLLLLILSLVLNITSRQLPALASTTDGSSKLPVAEELQSGDFSLAEAEALASIEKSVIETQSAPFNVVREEAPLKGARFHWNRQCHRNRNRHRNQPSEKLRNGWCELDCATSGSDSNRAARVCGSDGNWYESLCELKRAACLTSSHLFKRPREHCKKLPLPLPVPVGSKASRIRIVELKRRCNSSELAAMKVKLLDEFQGDLKKMFNHFDLNRDNLIEAHELWPPSTSSTNNLDSERLRYAQLWDEHSQRCHSFKESYSEATGSRQHEESKCWFYLELPFEPRYPPNACSLSHLMLFELPPGHYSFTMDSFERIFALVNQPSLDMRTGSGEKLRLALGDSAKVDCVNLEESSEEDEMMEKESPSGNNNCLWSRYNTNLASLQDPHVSIDEQTRLTLNDAQLYLSGPYQCHCAGSGLVRELSLEVIAKPRVQVRPKFQWSLPGSRVSFECLYDIIDTTTSGKRDGNDSRPAGGLQPPSGMYQSEPEVGAEAEASPRDELGQFGLRVEWLSGQGGEPICLSSSSSSTADEEGSLQNKSGISKDDDGKPIDWNWNYGTGGGNPLSSPALENDRLSKRASISMAASRLILENINSNDSGPITCQAELEEGKLSEALDSDTASLVVQESLPVAGWTSNNNNNNYLWMFHDNGISIYKLSQADGQEMELLREINGRSSIKAEVDGNWNQLTLCGGINSEQAVICEWSDNAIQINLNYEKEANNNLSGQVLNHFRRPRYVYVGQPNLNRVLVMEAELFEIVAIINTEPQPRKLFLYKPSKIHLSKWVRRRLSPTSNKRWLSAIEEGKAHPLQKTPTESILSSERPTSGSRSKRETTQNVHQFDIWLLCYGQPLVLNPAGDGLASDESLLVSTETGSDNKLNSSLEENNNSKQAFTPRLLGQQRQQGSYWPSSAMNNNQNIDLEARLRNRKSVHIIQSSFLPLIEANQHQHQLEESAFEARQFSSSSRRGKNLTVVGQFQHSTVLTTHHIYAATGSGSGQQEARSSTSKRRNLDLIHDLIVPPKPHSLELNVKHKIHYAYVTHYNQANLFRVNMDEYKYDKEIDLDCDPINLITTAQGLLIINCRSLISHNLIGQLVLDQLTSSRIEFNDNIRAQEAYLSPDNRYLVSVYTSTTTSFKEENSIKMKKRKEKRSVVYVQLIGVKGLRLEYEINLSLEIGQCSFVWKDGYYAAVFVSSNPAEQQSEILSLRLADGRLELTARVPGLISNLRHKDQLIVSSELRLAALTTNLATYVVDLQENRLLQSLRRHQSQPTLLWI